MEVPVKLLQRDSVVVDGDNGRLHIDTESVCCSLAVRLDRHVSCLDQLHHVSSKVASWFKALSWFTSCYPELAFWFVGHGWDQLSIIFR